MLFRSAALAAVFALAATLAHAAGVQLIEFPAGASGLPLKGAVWSPCATPAGEVRLIAPARRPLVAPGTMSCPVLGQHLPLIVVSHGYHGWYGNEHDTAELLAAAGFVVAAIDHPSDSGPDMSRADDLSTLAERPADIRRLIDFMLDAWADHATLDPDGIGFLGFSRGGYTGLVLIGGNPDLHKIADLCPAQSPLPYCRQVRNNEFPTEAFVHDTRIKAAVLADPAFGALFVPDGLKDVKVPVQLWASTYSGNGMTLDGVSPTYEAAIDRGLTAPHEYHVVANATHFAFLPPCRPVSGETVAVFCLDAPGFDRAAFRKDFNSDVLAFMRKNLTDGRRP